MQDIGMNKQCREQRPYSALFEVAQTEDKICFGECRILLPPPEARSNASKYQQCVGFQGVVEESELDFYEICLRESYVSISVASNFFSRCRDQVTSFRPNLAEVCLLASSAISLALRRDRLKSHKIGHVKVIAKGDLEAYRKRRNLRTKSAAQVSEKSSGNGKSGVTIDVEGNLPFS